MKQVNEENNSENQELASEQESTNSQELKKENLEPENNSSPNLKFDEEVKSENFEIPNPHSRESQEAPPIGFNAESSQEQFVQPQHPQQPPQQPYNAQTGYQQSYQGQNPAQGQQERNYQQFPQQGGYQQQYAQPLPRVRKHKDFTVAYAFLLFLGFIGGHKFYLGQVAHGVAYAGLWLIGSLLTFVGIGFLIYLAVLVLLYVDARTMPEQTIRSNNGEEFTINNLMDFVKMGFNPPVR